MNTEYTSKDIMSLSDTDAIRKRPGMYISTTDTPGHMFTEVLDNASDEALSGFCNRIIAYVDTKENKYAVRDMGRGIPHGKTQFADITGEIHELETLQLLFTKSHSGGKFEENSYKFSRGLHGVGNKIINALSIYAKAITYRDGKYVKLEMSQGKILNLEYGETTEPNGTYVEFIPDKEIFDTDIIPMSHIMDIMGISKAHGIPVELVVDGEEVELPYNSIYDLFPKMDEEVSIYMEQDFNSREGTGEGMMFAIRYTSDINYNTKAFTNMIPNPQGGSHVRFFDDCYKECWKKYLTDDFKLNDIFVGFRSVVSVFISNEALSFSGQTKERLTTPKKYFDSMKDSIIKTLQVYFDSHDDIRNALIKRFEEYRRSQNNLLARKEIMSLIKVNEPVTSSNKIRRRSVVPSLYECKNSSREGTEIILVEGDSAAGGYSRARNRSTQAILPCGGKIKNVTYMNINDALKSEDIRNIINSIGAGVGPDADPRRSRYERIILSSDADPDGKHITALELSVMVNLLPELVKAGMVWVLHAPLYKWTKGKEYKYVMTQEEIPEGAKYQRFKGLGEFEDDELKEALLDENNRILTQVLYPNDIDEFNRILGTSSGRADVLKELGVLKWI